MLKDGRSIGAQQAAPTQRTVSLDEHKAACIDVPRNPLTHTKKVKDERRVQSFLISTRALTASRDGCLLCFLDQSITDANSTPTAPLLHAARLSAAGLRWAGGMQQLGCRVAAAAAPAPTGYKL